MEEAKYDNQDASALLKNIENKLRAWNISKIEQKYLNEDEKTRLRRKLSRQKSRFKKREVVCQTAVMSRPQTQLTVSFFLN
jgi:hypothetical protein